MSPVHCVLNCKMERIKKHQNIIYVMLCNVSCNFRCKVLVLSRYCTVDGTFLCLLYVSNVKKKGLLLVYLLFLKYVYTYIVNVLITISMPFWESQ